MNQLNSISIHCTMIGLQIKPIRMIKMSNEIIIYSSTHCPYCVRAKNLLNKKGVEFTEILVDVDDKKRDEMIAKTNLRTVPQIFINQQHIGGCDDLYALENAGKLDELLR